MMSLVEGCRVRRIVVALLSVLAFTIVDATAAETPAPTALQLSLDQPVNAVAALFVVAQMRGLFGAEHVNVSTNIANGPLDAIARVVSGASDVAVTDINALIRYRDKAGAVPVKAVLMVQNRAGYAIVARKNHGIRMLSDMPGKTLGVAEGDLSIWLLPAVARATGILLKEIRQQGISAAVSEPLLASGQIDAVTALSYSSGVDLKDRGIPADDLTVLRFADYGCEAYGLAVIVNPNFATAKPEALKSFLRAVIAGAKLAVKDPTRAIDDVLTQMQGGSREIELARLQVLMSDTLLTAEVNRNGFGELDAARFDRSIDQIGEGFKFRTHPSPADIFDNEFLPPRAQRTLD